jgi:predicted TIM-barrel fold metal-dependent hydrolase
MTVTLLKKPLPAPIPKGKFRVVDADAHIDPPHTFWGEYLPEKFKHMAPTIEEGDECDFVVFEGRKRPLIMLANQAGRAGQDFKIQGKLADLHDSATPARRLDVMNEDGVDVEVLYGGGPLGSSNSELYIQSYRSYNRWLADFCNYDRNRLSGVAYLPMRDIDETLEMIREAVKLGLTTINIPAFPQNPDGLSSAGVVGTPSVQGAALTGDPGSERCYWHPEYDRFWAEIQDLDVTVTFHLGGRVARFGQKEHFLSDLVMTKVAMAEPVAMAIFGGIFDRFPRLRWGIIESGVGWMPWMAEYMDRTWEKQRFWTGSTLKNLPSYYMDQNIYGSFINDRLGFKMTNEPGGKNVMWSSDFPHSETTYPNSLSVIARDSEGLSDEQIAWVVGGCADKFFNLK